MKVAVVTPTIGTEYLTQCLQSVENQSYQDLTHYLFLDGQEYEKNIWYQIGENSSKVKTVRLQENIGKGWYGHRVYAACSFLVNADVICYLDEDNWLEPNHVQKIVEKIQKGNDWVFSLRKIFDKDGNFICEDNCESLGKWPAYFNDSVFHVDTSCFGVRRDIAVRIGHAWYGQWGADRQFFNSIKKHFNRFDCTNEYSVCYRLDGNENSVKQDFFLEGNKIQKNKYKEFPWTRKNDSISVAPGISIII